MIPRIGPICIREELLSARALAIDFAENVEPQEQAGHIYDIQSLFGVRVGDAVNQRLIRRVVKPSDKWGDLDKIVDTTKRDSEESLSREPRSTQHWYLEDDLSPAMLVLDVNDSASSAAGRTIVDVLSEGIDNEALHLMLHCNVQPTTALLRHNMAPEDVWKFVKDRTAHAMEAIYL